MGGGAKFIVSPGLNPDVVRHCRAMGYPIVPGFARRARLKKALSFGLKYLKFFPAEAAGGVKMIKRLWRRPILWFALCRPRNKRI